MINYQKERVVIIGLGFTGLSCVNFFLSRGVIPLVMDTQFFPRCLKYLPQYVQYCLGSLNEKWILDATLIVVSPGVSLSHPFLLQAIKLGIKVVGDIELFIHEVHKPIIAITGSSGKSTVTTLLSEMALHAGLFVGVGGNIGLPALMLLRKSYQLYILELSSFQLETIYNLRATIATVLNVSYDHMDRYPFGLSQYCSVKLKIYKNAKTCLINASDSLTYPRCIDNHKNCISFGHEFGDYHLGWLHGKRCLMFDSKPILYCSEMRIFGYHNYINALAAIALADTIMIPREYSLFVLRKFSGLSHCLELVHENHGIRWINDSKATNINSTIAAINSLSNFNGVLHLLLGGNGKSVDFLPLAYLIRSDKVKIYCFGQDGRSLANLNFNDAILTENMEQAMYIIGNQVRKSDIVLLSPACSSLDQFKNFMVRGYVFSYLSKKIG